MVTVILVKVLPAEVVALVLRQMSDASVAALAEIAGGEESFDRVDQVGVLLGDQDVDGDWCRWGLEDQPHRHFELPRLDLVATLEVLADGLQMFETIGSVVWETELLD